MNNDIVKMWIKKADNDFKIGVDEINTDNPTTDAICFHMQQCIEKYLKSFLIFNNIEILKTHNIWLLLDKCSEIDKEFNIYKTDKTEIISDYGVDIRYPDDFYEPSLIETKNAIDLTINIKEFVKQKLISSGYKS